MATLTTDHIDRLDNEDKKKLDYFARLLIQQSKYRHLKTSISQRRKEIENGEVLEHDEIWKSLDV
jgi:predicted transcriptional regulator